jgi:hypothetical protein
MSAENVTRSEIQLSVGWMEKNPALAVSRIVEFLDGHKSACIEQYPTAGFITLTWDCAAITWLKRK